MATFETVIYPEHVRVADSTHHVLIAGASGSGKSTFLDGVINAIMCKNPNNYQFVLIDPKRVGLSIYKNTWHCAGYASEPEDTVKLLDMCLQLVDRRYREMELAGVREYKEMENARAKLYIIIDELSDVVFTSREAFNRIERLARIARAANIQLICATQCILSEVIPTKLKCNLDMRVALPTASASDSRVIMGVNGAETLNKGEAIIKDGNNINKVKTHKVNDEMLRALIQFRTRRTATA